MGQSAYIWVLLILSLLAANAPFINSRIFCIFKLPAFLQNSKQNDKSFAARLAECVILYFVIGAIGLLMEKNIGQIYPQGWEFYAITASLFLTFAFPGFVYRYLLKH